MKGEKVQQQGKTRIVWVDRIAAIVVSVLCIVVAYILFGSSWGDFRSLPSEYQAVGFLGAIKFAIAGILITTTMVFLRDKW